MLKVDLDPRILDKWDSRNGNTIDARNSSWDKQLEKGLPDCRVSFGDRETSRVPVGRMMWDKVYCAQCHKLCMACSPNIAHVFYLCNSCAHNGPPPGCIEVK